MKVLGIFAHPDDETILIGGTLAMLASCGADLSILSATRGEGGELGEPPLTQRNELGEIRERELRCAAEALGASEVDFLGYIDPVIEVGGEGFAFDADPKTLSGQIHKRLQDQKPDVVITHGSNGEYGHPAHILVNQSVIAATRRSGGCLYGISANFNGHPRPRLANQDDPAHLVLDISAWLDTKLAAAQCHRTQHALFVRRSSQEAGRQVEIADVLMHLESLHRFFPAPGQKVGDPLSDFLTSSCRDALQGIDQNAILTQHYPAGASE
jgi:LmbE family N-acetylglucosaminyl deacetylase